MSTHTQVLVIGAGPGGYTAAFRAADLGLEVTLIERHERLGGVCLNVGCIPSKALLHVAKVIRDAERAGQHGVAFGPPRIELEPLRAFKEDVVGRLTGGLAALARQRGVRVLHGSARLSGPDTVELASVPGEEPGQGALRERRGNGASRRAAELAGQSISFEHAILASGSRPTRLPGIHTEDARVLDSTGALALEELPERLLVVGGGIIGLEMATVYSALGARVTIVEREEQLIPGCDADLVKPLQRSLSKRAEAIHLSCTLAGLKDGGQGLEASFSGGPEPAVFDRVLVAVGRRPNSEHLGLEEAGVEVDERGFVHVDAQMRTNVAAIHAIGDLAGPPMLAHKALHEAKVAAEAIAGMDVAFDVRGIPTVAYTDPELAWVGLTETEAARRGIAFERAVFPWQASGRALTLDSASGLTKLLLDPDTRRVLGAGIVGTNAGELIAEPGLALELGADAEDLALTVHSHPTLSETIGLAAEVALGTVTDLAAGRGREAAGRGREAAGRGREAARRREEPAGGRDEPAGRR